MNTQSKRSIQLPINSRPTLLSLMLVALLAAALTACGVSLSRPGETVTQTESVERGGADSVAVNVQGGVGELALTGGAADLFSGEFRYNLEELAATVDYTVSGDQGTLIIEPAADDFNTIPTGEVVSEWDLQFAEDVPLAMDVALGLGDSDLDFNGLSLTELAIRSGAGRVTANAGRQTLDRIEFQAGLGDVTFTVPGGRVDTLDFEAGAGDVEIDLTGDWEADLDASIRAGLGELTVRVPAGAGVRVAVEQGLGEINADGFTLQDGAYVNDAYGEGQVTLEIEIQQGAGDINLIAE